MSARGRGDDSDFIIIMPYAQRMERKSKLNTISTYKTCHSSFVKHEAPARIHKKKSMTGWSQLFWQDVLIYLICNTIYNLLYSLAYFVHGEHKLPNFTKKISVFFHLRCTLSFARYDLGRRYPVGGDGECIIINVFLIDW